MGNHSDDPDRSRWAQFTNFELVALYAGLEAADRDDSIDHGGKALKAEVVKEYQRRIPGALG